MDVPRDGPGTRWAERLIAVSLIVVMLVVMWRVFEDHILWVGFPDSYIPELDGAEMVMAGWFNWFSFALIVGLMLLIWRSFFARIGRVLIAVVGLYVVVVAGVVVLDMHFRTYMMDGRGG